VCSRRGKVNYGRGQKDELNVHGKKKGDQPKNKSKIPAQAIIKKDSKCFFCKKKRHMKKDYLKFKS